MEAKCDKCGNVNPTQSFNKIWKLLHPIVCSFRAERSEVPQGCLPSPNCSAPERSGEVEQGGDYLTRSAPVERSAADVELKDVLDVEVSFELKGNRWKLLKGILRPNATNLKIVLTKCDLRMRRTAADSGQRSAPKAESKAKPRRRSEAQARNADLRQDAGSATSNAK